MADLQAKEAPVATSKIDLKNSQSKLHLYTRSGQKSQNEIQT